MAFHFVILYLQYLHYSIMKVYIYTLRQPDPAL